MTTTARRKDRRNGVRVRPALPGEPNNPFGDYELHVLANAFPLPRGCGFFNNMGQSGFLTTDYMHLTPTPYEIHPSTLHFDIGRFDKYVTRKPWPGEPPQPKRAPLTLDAELPYLTVDNYRRLVERARELRPNWAIGCYLALHWGNPSLNEDLYWMAIADLCDYVNIGCHRNYSDPSGVDVTRALVRKATEIGQGKPVLANTIPYPELTMQAMYDDIRAMIDEGAKPAVFLGSPMQYDPRAPYWVDCALAAALGSALPDPANYPALSEAQAIAFNNSAREAMDWRDIVRANDNFRLATAAEHTVTS